MEVYGGYGPDPNKNEKYRKITYVTLEGFKLTIVLTTKPQRLIQELPKVFNVQIFRTKLAFKRYHRYS